MVEQEKRQTYTENLASINTALIYVNNHLQNIDTHLERINGTLTDHDKQIIHNTTRLGGIQGMIGAVFAGGAAWLARLQGWW